MIGSTRAPSPQHENSLHAIPLSRAAAFHAFLVRDPRQYYRSLGRHSSLGHSSVGFDFMHRVIPCDRSAIDCDRYPTGGHPNNPRQSTRRVGVDKARDSTSGPRPLASVPGAPWRRSCRPGCQPSGPLERERERSMEAQHPRKGMVLPDCLGKQDLDHQRH